MTLKVILKGKFASVGQTSNVKSYPTANDEKVSVADKYVRTAVLDRVGSGDAFVAGLIYGLLENRDLEFSINCGAAHGVLAMTTVGDNSTATVQKIERLISDGEFAVRR